MRIRFVATPHHRSVRWANRRKRHDQRQGRPVLNAHPGPPQRKPCAEALRSGLLSVVDACFTGGFPVRFMASRPGTIRAEAAASPVYRLMIPWLFTDRMRYRYGPLGITLVST